MLIFKLVIAFVILSLRSTATVKGKFNYCNKDGCEEIDEIEVVQLFDTCTDYPFVKFLSKTLNKMCSGFINQLGDLVTEAQPSVVCDRNIKINKYDGFTIQREKNRAKVTYPNLESKISEEIVQEIFNRKYFKRPIGEILKDFYLIGISIIISFIIIFVIWKYKQILRKKLFKVCSCLTPHWLSKLIKNCQKNINHEGIIPHDNIDEILVEKTLVFPSKKKEPKILIRDKSQIEEKKIKSNSHGKIQSEIFTDDEDYSDILTHSSYFTPPPNPTAPPIQRQIFQSPYPLYPPIFPMPIHFCPIFNRSLPTFVQSI